jgi:hypothetical protein
MRAPEWTSQEFEKVLTSCSMDVNELARSLPGRSVGAIEVVRQGIHSYHLGRDSTMLSETMLDRLADSGHQANCPICGHVVGR